MVDVTDQINQCKHLVAYLKKSGSAHILPHAVVQESKTRWNTKAEMLNSIARQHSEIRELLQGKGQEHRIEGIQVEVLTAVGEFLTPFKHASEDMEGDRYPTINSVLLWYHRLRMHCEPRCGDPLYMEHIRRRAGELLNDKMTITPIHKIATFLSPRFKSLKMLSPDESLVVQAEARRLTTALIPALQAQTAQKQADDTSETQREAEAIGPTMRENLLKRRRMFLEWEDTLDLIEPDEVQHCMQSHFSLDECNEDVLGFWGAHCHDFPLMSMLARAVLCVPATSASSKRAFSSVGRVLEARRNRLNPGTVDAILFLHSASKQLS
ncbi:E3 SUMO-protein ligase ZBED1-like isoform X3 [Neoarius graeffei]|uniref:E3 SUMO-protein ligase ZBED1-like isoform X3 n=1 Tax=Neoarius graeffei TaxID=443677 RepID=UPI00298BD5E0|nr:E3 SUMO-protein ligase ZBED1-like isoform X3 [Neoarius graeffei]